MWPFSFFAERIYRRRYNAALLVLLAASMMQRMNDSQRTAVESEVRNITRHYSIVAWPARKWSPTPANAILRAQALAQLGIEPSISSVRWEDLFKPWSRPEFVWLDFRRFHPATERAKAFLKESGLEVPAL